MKNTPNQLFEQLSKEFSSKKDKELLNEELGQIVTLKPINTIEASAKDPFWTKFENFLAEGGTLEPLVNNEDKVKYNTKEQDEKVKANPKLKYEMDSKLAGSYKVSDGVENIDSHNYDYDPKVENINNVNAQEVLSGVQLEINYNKELSLDEAMELAVKNLAKDPLHYVKEGQFGVQGLGYKEGKQQQNDGESYGGSGFSTKLKDGGDSMELVKESKELVLEAFGQVVSSGNPNSLAAQSGNLIRQMMAEKEEEKKLPMDEMEDEGTAVSYSDTTSEAAKPDFMDIDGDGDKKESMKKAGKDMKAKKPKKESIDTKLAEIGKAGDVTKMEAQLEFLSNYISEKSDRVNSISEDENLSELVDKKKMKDMQREIKLLEKRRGKMEKMYEKMCGKKYQQAEIVDEMNDQSVFDFANPTGGPTLDPYPRKVGKGTGKSYLNRPSGPAKHPTNEINNINEMAAGGLEEKSAGKKLFAAFKKDGLKPNYIADVRKVSSDGEAKDMVHIEPGEGSVEVSSASNQDKIAQAIKSAGFNISKKEDNVGNYKLSVFTIDIK